MYGCESWTIKKAQCQRIDAFELWCWRRLLRVAWTARRSNHSILKEISPKYSLEGLMLKLMHFGHLMQRTDSFEKTVMLGKIEGGRRRDNRGWDGWMSSPTQWTWVWVNSRSWWWTGRPGVLQSMGSQRVGHDWATELNWFLASLFIVSKCWKELWCPPKGEWINQIGCNLNRGACLAVVHGVTKSQMWFTTKPPTTTAIKWNELLNLELLKWILKWSNLKILVLNERVRQKKATTCVILCAYHSRKCMPTRLSRSVVAWRWALGKNGYGERNRLKNKWRSFGKWWNVH